MDNYTDLMQVVDAVTKLREREFDLRLYSTTLVIKNYLMKEKDVFNVENGSSLPSDTDEWTFIRFIHEGIGYSLKIQRIKPRKDNANV